MGQKIYTPDGGVIEVEQSYVVMTKFDKDSGKEIQRGGHIAKLTNGAWVNIPVLPLQDEKQIKEILCTPDLKAVRDECLEWFRNRDKLTETPLRKVMFDAMGYPCWENGSFVESDDELHECLKDRDVLSMAIRGLGKRRDAEQSAGLRKDLPAQRTMAASKKTSKGAKKPAGKAKQPPAPPIAEGQALPV